MEAAGAAAASSSILLHSRSPEVLCRVSKIGFFARNWVVCSRTAPFFGWRRCMRIKIGASGESRGSRGEFIGRESQQVVETSPLAVAKEIASTVAPGGAFVVVTFVLWKLVEKILIPKPNSPTTAAVENKPTGDQSKCSFATAGNMLSGLSAKLDRQAKQKLNDFSEELRSFPIIDLSGHNFGDEGLFFLAESLACNQVAEDVSFAANGITTDGAKAFDGVLQTNIGLKTLNLSGNLIGDEGVKVIPLSLLIQFQTSVSGKITNLDIGNNSITSKGAFYVAEFVKKRKSLKWLNLYMNDIGDEGAEKMAEALKENLSLAVTDLGGNNIHARGITATAHVFKDNSVITSLGVAYNPNGPEGAQALSEVLKFHGHGWCQIGPNGAEYVADMLKYNTSISTLDLRANGLKDDVCAFNSGHH